MTNATGEPEVGKFILGFLLKNPDAEDTLEGIVEWWLMRERIEYETGRVRAALEDLVEKGFVLERKRSGSDMRYRLNERKVREVQSYLKQNRKRTASTPAKKARKRAIRL
jgi:DNA-binding transcriptional regulator PaaX